MFKFIGITGASVISRVMGIVLATIAIDAILGGFEALGVLNIAPTEVISLPADGSQG